MKTVILGMKSTFASFSLGCRVNEAERQVLEHQMLASGFSLDSQSPAICLINTCAVTAKAEREARQLVYRLRRNFPQAKIVITGCAATHWQKNQLYQKLPIDLLVDNANKKHLVRLLASNYSKGHPTGGRKKTLNRLMNSGRALVKIQDGCQRFCSYCIIPYLRGQPRSYRINDIVKSLQLFHDREKEVILTAINTEAFGYDTGEKYVELVKTIIDKTAIPRISFGSINPWSVNKEFFRFYRKYLPNKRLVNFFHIPLQSGSNKILSLMKRGYTKEEFSEKLNELYKINPYAFIATDIIVGFPGENDIDFKETFDFLKSSPISRFHIFRFSRRDNTAAYNMAKNLKEPSDETKIKRARLLRELGLKKYNQFMHTLVDYAGAALFINKKRGEYQQALLDNQVATWIKTAKNLNGKIKNIKIIGFKNGELFGKIT